VSYVNDFTISINLNTYVFFANSQQPTANSQQPTANSQQPIANSQQPTANSQYNHSLACLCRLCLKPIIDVSYFRKH